MLKRSIARWGIISLALLITLTSCGVPSYNGDIVAVVNKEKIYSEQVEERIMFNTISNMVYIEYVSEHYAQEDQDEALLKGIMSEDFDGVLAELVEAEVCRQYLKNQDLDVSYMAAKNSTDLAWETMVNKDDFMFERLTYAIDEHDLTVEQFLQLSYAQQYDYLNVSLTRKNYFQSIEQNELSEDKTNTFIQSLIDDAKIEYFL